MWCTVARASSSLQIDSTAAHTQAPHLRTCQPHAAALCPPSQVERAHLVWHSCPVDNVSAARNSVILHAQVIPHAIRQSHAGHTRPGAL